MLLLNLKKLFLQYQIRYVTLSHICYTMSYVACQNFTKKMLTDPRFEVMHLKSLRTNNLMVVCFQLVNRILIFTMKACEKEMRTFPCEVYTTFP